MVSSAQADQPMADYEAHLRDWVSRSLVECALLPEVQAFVWWPLSGDAGFRRYFRLSLGETSLLAVYAPPATENNRGFLAIDTFFRSQGVNAPKIYAHDVAQGFFLLEDFGETLYLGHLNEESAPMLYGEALFALLRIQQCPLDETVFPLYSRERLHDELRLFPQWFIAQLLGHTLTTAEQQVLDACFALLLDSAEAQPRSVVHRDFHSRNLVYGPGGTPGIIDFQDAVIGPLTYDVVSLLRDCYIAWPAAQVRTWALAYGSLARDAGVLPEVSEAEFLRWFDLMGLQRHIKVLGIFARLSLRDGKHGYLKDLPLVLHYVRSVAANYDELQPFLSWFDAVLLPRILNQPWAEGKVL